MKKIVVLITMLFPITTIAQTPNWTSLKETNITVGGNAYDIFTNREGNHIIVQESNALKYYIMDVNGGTTLNLNPPLESSAVISPSISGDATRLYVVYRKSNENFIRTKVSTNGGVSWSYLSTNPPNSNASSIECEYSKEKLHITFLVGNIVYYNYYDVANPGWLTQNSTVSDPQITSAVNPRIRINSGGCVDTVYFVFNPSANTLSWRRYTVGEPTLGPINPIQTQGDNTYHIGFAINNSYLYAFSRTNAQSVLIWNIRRIWNNSHIIAAGNSNGNYTTSKIFSTTTIGNIPYTAAWDHTNDPPPTYRISRIGFNGNDLVEDLIYQNQNLAAVNIVNLSSAENDVHVVWKDNLGTNNGNNLRYKYYDDIPLVPQNLAVSVVDLGEYSSPVLTWSFNNAPDVYINESAHEIQRRTRPVPGNFGNWGTIGYTAGDIKSYTDTEISIEGTGSLYQAEYRIRAIDIGDHTSDWSATVSIYFGQFAKLSTNTQSYEFQLSQNFPNPFNPTTTISYSIKSTGMVTLKVFDMLGTEVASLVNEVKETGDYSIVFDGSNLPSGMYVYQLITENFMDSKKLILLK